MIEFRIELCDLTEKIPCDSTSGAHNLPPYMGQKIRSENGQPIIIDQKERASLTPIGM